jgi:hypothetical protein
LEIESVPKLPDFFEFPKAEPEPTSNGSPGHIPTSVMNGADPLPDWVYQEIPADPIVAEDKAEGNGEEEDVEEQHEDPDAERPKVDDENKVVESFIRSSFIVKRGTNLIEMSRLLPSRAEVDGADQDEKIVDVPEKDRDNRLNDNENPPKDPYEKEEHDMNQDKNVHATDPKENDVSDIRDEGERECVVDVEELEKLVNEAREFIGVMSDDVEVQAAQHELKEILGSVVEKENGEMEEKVRNLVTQMKKNISELEKYGREMGESGDEILRLLYDV